MSTPTKAAEIREALELAMARIGCPPGDNADADIYHRLSRALALLADTEGKQEPVAWLNEYMGLTMNDRSKRMHDAEGTNHGYTIPLYRHPSPTTADAKDSAVDVQEVIKAGDELTKIKGALCNFILSLAPRDRDGHFTKDELDRMTDRWTKATKPFRP